MPSATNNGQPTTDTVLQKDYDLDLHRRLRAYQQEHSLKLAALARELDTNTTQLSKYLSARPEGNVAKLESKIRDVLKNAETRKASRVQLFHNSVTKVIAGKLETIRKTNDVALIHSRAGLGKTCACQLYITEHPTALLLTATKMQKSAHALAQLLFAQSSAGWPGNIPRITWLTDKFRASNRLIIIDNAQRLTRGAVEFILDFHDETGCPIAFLGNTEILDTCRKSDQLHTRIGIVYQIKDLKDPEQNVQTLVEQLWPEANGDLNHLGQVVIEETGHLRALKKQVLLAKDIHENLSGLGKRVQPADAFRSAHTQLIRDYPLS